MTIRAIIILVLLSTTVACGDNETSPGTSQTVDAVSNSPDTLPSDTKSDSSPQDIVDTNSDVLQTDVSPGDTDSIADIEAAEDANDTAQIKADGTNSEDSSVTLSPPPPAVPAGVMFRVDYVQVIKPGFCLKTPEKPDDCADISNLLNAYLGMHVDDSKNPMDIIGLFQPFDFGDGTNKVDMSFGRGTCKRASDGDIEYCDFWGEPTFFDGTNMQQPGACTVFTDGAACYSTIKADMDLNFAGVPLGFNDAFTAGTFSLDDKQEAKGIAYGYVQGFLTTTTAEKTMVTADILDGEVTLASLLDYEYLTKNEAGIEGWYFQVDYKANVVPQKF